MGSCDSQGRSDGRGSPRSSAAGAGAEAKTLIVCLGCEDVVGADALLACSFTEAATVDFDGVFVTRLLIVWLAAGGCLSYVCRMGIFRP